MVSDTTVVLLLLDFWFVVVLFAWGASAVWLRASARYGGSADSLGTLVFVSATATAGLVLAAYLLAFISILVASGDAIGTKEVLVPRANVLLLGAGMVAVIHAMALNYRVSSELRIIETSDNRESLWGYLQTHFGSLKHERWLAALLKLAPTVDEVVARLGAHPGLAMGILCMREKHTDLEPLLDQVAMDARFSDEVRSCAISDKKRLRVTAKLYARTLPSPDPFAQALLEREEALKRYQAYSYDPGAPPDPEDFKEIAQHHEGRAVLKRIAALRSEGSEPADKRLVKAVDGSSPLQVDIVCPKCEAQLAATGFLAVSVEQLRKGAMMPQAGQKELPCPTCGASSLVVEWARAT